MDNKQEINRLADKHSIINWFIHNHVAANLLMASILLVGLYMVGFFGLFGQHAKLRLEVFPSQEWPVIVISANINSSTPEDVEDGVTTKIEQVLQGVEGIEKTTSESGSNHSQVVVYVKTDYVIDKLYDDIKTRVDSIENLPVEKIIVIRPLWQPEILSVILHGNAEKKVLKSEANRLKNILLRNPYIEKIDVKGSQPFEISIEVSESTLKQYKLTLNQIASAIDDASLNLSSGKIETEKGRLSLHIKSQAHNQTDYENLIIRSASDGSLLRLGDIAKVSDGFVETKHYAGFDDQPSITLTLKTGKNANVIEADKASSNIINAFKKTLPENIKVTIWDNSTHHVKDRINLLIKNGATAVLLVFLLLTLFLNIRLAFWVALGIPISLCGALILMGIFDISISLISLFGFILVLGIVVDDAIIIGESIYLWKSRTNNDPKATLIGASRVSVVATFGVLTTIAAFLPLTQIDGILGDILGEIAFVIIFCLLFSLVESKLILPSHLHSIRVATRENKSKNSWGKLQNFLAHGLESFVEKVHLPLLTRALRHPYFTLVIFLSIFILAIGTIIGKILPISMIPRVEGQNIILTVEMDNSVGFDETMRLAKKATKDLQTTDQQLMQKHGTYIPNIKNIMFHINNTTFSVVGSLASSETRKTPGPIIANRWREIVGEIPQSKSINFGYRTKFSGNDIELQVFGEDRQKQSEAGKVIADAIKQIEGVKDINSNQEETNNVLIDLKPEAGIYGISKTKLAQTIRMAFYGIEAERFQRKDEEVPVVVKYPENERKSLTDLYQLNVRTGNGKAIPITEVANLSYTQSLKNIKHINGQRSLIISANLDKNKISYEKATAIIMNKIAPKIQQQYDVTIALGGESYDGGAVKSMKLGFLISLGLIYILLAIPLKSYFHPLIIMSVIPFGITGAIIGHLLLGMDLSILSFCGIIALSGVVVNDSLLLLSTIHKNQEEGLGFYESVLAAGVRRFRPIILTSITTFVGLLPMLFETSFQAQFLIPMAVSLGFGILFATAITLILVPVIYVIFNNIFQCFFRKVPSDTIS